MINHTARTAKLSGLLARSFALFNLLFLGTLLGVATASTSTDPTQTQGEFQTTYFDVATSGLPSGVGYGGPGFSGGAGDNTVRIINPTAANGDLCAMIYVFDDREEMQTCCGCPVSPDGEVTLSTVNNLTLNFGVNKGNLNAGVIKIVSSKQNFTPGVPPPAPLPPGTNGKSSGSSPLACSPTGLASSDLFHRATAVQPTAGLRSWITRDEVMQPGVIAGGKAVQSPMVDEFQDSPLDGTELTDLQQRCASLITNGSGTGVCNCGLFP